MEVQINNELVVSTSKGILCDLKEQTYMTFPSMIWQSKLGEDNKGRQTNKIAIGEW